MCIAIKDKKKITVYTVNGLELFNVPINQPTAVLSDLSGGLQIKDGQIIQIRFQQ